MKKKLYKESFQASGLDHNDGRHCWTEDRQAQIIHAVYYKRMIAENVCSVFILV